MIQCAPPACGSSGCWFVSVVLAGMCVYLVVVIHIFSVHLLHVGVVAVSLSVYMCAPGNSVHLLHVGVVAVSLSVLYLLVCVCTW